MKQLTNQPVHAYAKYAAPLSTEQLSEAENKLARMRHTMFAGKLNQEQVHTVFRYADLLESAKLRNRIGGAER